VLYIDLYRSVLRTNSEYEDWPSCAKRAFDIEHCFLSLRVFVLCELFVSVFEKPIGRVR
jgi:hypothetical protein